MIGVSVLLLVAVPAADPPKPKWPLGKETTYVTGPIDKDGYIDYAAALNERLAKGITPETNANVLIWKALGPRPLGDQIPAEYFAALGITRPPERGNYFIGLAAYLDDGRKPDKVETDIAWNGHVRDLARRPWTAKDDPRVAAWLVANEKPLAIVTAASKRPDYFNPLVAPRTESGRGLLLGAGLPSVQVCRSLTAALAARATLRVGERRFDEAWQDVLAGHRLTRLVGRGGTLIEGLVGAATEATINDAHLAYLGCAPLTAAQAGDRLNELRGLPRLTPAADRIDVYERLIMLEVLQAVRRDYTVLSHLAAGEAIAQQIAGPLNSGKPLPADFQLKLFTIVRATDTPRDPKLQQAIDGADWGPPLRNLNRWFDRVAAGLRTADRPARERELRKFADDLKALKEKATDPGNDLTGENIGNVVIALMMPAFTKVQAADDRTEQRSRNLHIAFALAAYRRDAGRYPANLDELAPKYLAAVPADLFSGKPLVYRPTGDGYILYSVGTNGQDDGGRSYDDDPPADDLTVRVPLPELKVKR